MDIATLVGLLAAFGLILSSMASGGSIMAFVNTPSIMIVVGGTIAATLINESLGQVLGAIKVCMQAFFEKPTDSSATIDKVLDLAGKARKEGLVSLENEEIEEPFLARGVRLGVDGLNPEAISDILKMELGTLKTRHVRGQTVFRFAAATAPSMGMVGTLVGLVQMLQTLDDPAAIGPSMAVALLTTLYGAIIAFVVCIPIASKLEQRTRDEVAACNLAIAGVDSILKGENSMVIQSRLEAFLHPPEKAARAESNA